MKPVLALAFLAALLLGSACSPLPPGCCGRRTDISRDVVYTGTLASPDGGTPTEVRVTVASNGKTTLTFINDGHELVEGFDGVVFLGP